MKSDSPKRCSLHLDNNLTGWCTRCVDLLRRKTSSFMYGISTASVLNALSCPSRWKELTPFRFSVLFFCRRLILRTALFELGLVYRLSRWEASLSPTIKTKGSSDRHDVCFYSTNVPSDTPPISLGSGTLTHSVFTAAGSLSAVFTHITGVKRDRFHNEVQRFMAAGTKMPSEYRNCGP